MFGVCVGLRLSVDVAHAQVYVGRVDRALYLSSHMYIGVCVCIIADACVGACLRVHIGVGVCGCTGRCVFIPAQPSERGCVIC